MVNIVDINTNENNLEEVTRLKDEFKAQLAAVKNGTVIIISNFSAVGDMIGPFNYVILMSIIYSKGNYLKRKVNGTDMYINNAVIHINSVEDNDILNANDHILQKADGEFEYMPSLRLISGDLHDYLLPYADIKPFGIYRLISANAEKYHNEKLMLNYELTAQYLLWAICWQTVNERTSKSVNSLVREHPYSLSNEALVAFTTKLISDLDKRTKNGILTKKKIDRITNSVKKVEEIYNNIGQSLSVISGKAGTGKTLMLSRLVQRHSKDYKVARLLTFNKMLVYDLIQTLRNFTQYSSLRLSIQTVHQFFYHQAKLLGITLIMGEQRVQQLLQLCDRRIELLRSIFVEFVNGKGNFREEDFLKLIASSGLDRADNKEFILFANFLKWGAFTDFDKAKEEYLQKKKNYLQPNVGHQMFLEDYNKVLEELYLAITNTEEFYARNNIRDRYDLLKTLYRLDKDEENGNAYISNEEFAGQVKRVRGSVNWSKLFLIDECQDFFIWEKEILYAIRGPENMVVATGGKEQLIRQNQLLDWSLSLGRKIPFLQFKLQDISYRQKQNIVKFVNAFGAAFTLPINLQSVGEQSGVGKVIIDCRPNIGLIDSQIAREMKISGEINECSPYESLLIMVPAKGYTESVMQQTVSIDEMDIVQSVHNTVSRKTKGLNIMEEAGYFCWDGVSEEKSKLKVPNQTDTRIIHYESCRGLEAWTCALMSFDQFFENKGSTNEAGTHLSDDLFLTESERRDKFAALWCLMALTRPIDTLYIHLENPGSDFSRKILDFSNGMPGVTLMNL